MGGNINIKIEKGLGWEGIENFNGYALIKANWVWNKVYNNRGDISKNIKISHEYSQYDHCLQFTDFLASGTFQLYEKKNYIYFKEFSHKIRNINYLLRKR